AFGNVLDSRKAAAMQGGVYLPLHFDSTSWQYRGEKHSLFAGPLMKGGFQTAVAPNSQLSDRLHGFYSAGFRLAHYRFENAREQRNIAPELISYMDITGGKWDNFNRRLRLQFEGRLKIPAIPMPFYTGFDANLGGGPDDLRFLFAVHFDIGKVVS